MLNRDKSLPALPSEALAAQMERGPPVDQSTAQATTSFTSSQPTSGLPVRYQSSSSVSECISNPWNYANEIQSTRTWQTESSSPSERARDFTSASDVFEGGPAARLQNGLARRGLGINFPGSPRALRDLPQPLVVRKVTDSSHPCPSLTSDALSMERSLTNTTFLTTPSQSNHVVTGASQIETSPPVIGSTGRERRTSVRFSQIPGRAWNSFVDKILSGGPDDESGDSPSRGSAPHASESSFPTPRSGLSRSSSVISSIRDFARTPSRHSKRSKNRASSAEATLASVPDVDEVIKFSRPMSNSDLAFGPVRRVSQRVKTTFKNVVSGSNNVNGVDPHAVKEVERADVPVPTTPAKLQRRKSIASTIRSFTTPSPHERRMSLSGSALAMSPFSMRPQTAETEERSTHVSTINRMPNRSLTSPRIPSSMLSSPAGPSIAEELETGSSPVREDASKAGTAQSIVEAGPVTEGRRNVTYPLTPAYSRLPEAARLEGDWKLHGTPMSKAPTKFPHVPGLSPVDHVPSSAPPTCTIRGRKVLFDNEHGRLGLEDPRVPGQIGEV